MPHQTSVNSNQTSVRRVPHLPQTDTIHLIDIWWMYGICLVDIWYIYGTVHVWWAYGTCLVYMWYLFDRCLVGVNRCLVGHLTVIWQSSGSHLTGATRQIATVWQKRWCKQPFGKGCEAVVYRICMTMGQTFLLSGDSTPTRLLCACDCDSVRRLFLTL